MTVYVVQNQMKHDGHGAFIPKFNLSSAEQYGQLKFLLSPTAQPFNSLGIIDELHEKLCDFKEDDYLLLIGNPCLIGFATAIAANYCPGALRLLQWSGKDQSYIEVRAQLFDCEEEQEE